MEGLPGVVNISFSIHSHSDHTILSYSEEEVQVTQHGTQWRATNTESDPVGWSAYSAVEAILHYLEKRLDEISE